eukprot:SAG11_NODE_9240_length_929_cov_2.281928_1_plen_122_part_01
MHRISDVRGAAPLSESNWRGALATWGAFVVALASLDIALFGWHGSAQRAALIAVAGPIDADSHLSHVQWLAARSPTPYAAAPTPVSALPLFERLKRSSGRRARAHPQQYKPLPTAAPGAGSR